MIHALVPVDLDLGSSIAIRYAEILSRLIDITLQSVHVVVPEGKGPEPGTGWVRKTWEKALMHTDREDIQHFLELENAVSPRFSVPKVLLGERQEELLQELKMGQYDLLVEGALPTFNLADFHTLVSSRLYRLMPCSAALVVKNLVKPERAALLFVENMDPKVFAAAFLHVLNKPVFELDLLYCGSGKPQRPASGKEDEARGLLFEAREMLEEKGWRVGACREVTGGSEDIAERLREYSLVASALERNPRRKSLRVEILGRVLSPVLICWN